MASFKPSNDRLGILHGLTQDFASPRARTSSAMSAASPPPPSTNKNSKDPTRRERSKSRERSRKNDKEQEEPKDAADYSATRKSKFRFKKHRSSRHRKDSHHSKRRKTYTAPIDDPAAYDDTYIPNLSSANYTPDAAFREALFDAMADDEGAAFWEGVYGQPIHTYPRPEYTDPYGELERMDDEEYARYVREKMWEKSHQHILEERRRREKEKEREKQKRREEEEEWRRREREEQRERKQREEDERRRERRREKKARCRDRWMEYIETWESILSGIQRGDEAREKNLIPWPVKSGKLADVEKDTVEAFFFSAPTKPLGERGDLFELLKVERVRWHPDKAQQRWGKGGLEEQELRGITAVFQTVDAMWAVQRDRREKIKAKR